MWTGYINLPTEGQPLICWSASLAWQHPILLICRCRTYVNKNIYGTWLSLSGDRQQGDSITPRSTPVLFFLSEKSCQFVTHVLHRLTKLPAVKMGNLEFDGGDFKTGGKTRTNLVCRPAGYSKFETDCLLVVKFVAMVNLSLFHFPSANWLRMLSRHARCYWAWKKKKSCSNFVPQWGVGSD